MSAHPNHETLADFAWGILEDEGGVEEHVEGCAECALYVERCRIEARRIAGALKAPAPAGLAASILDSQAVKAAGPRRRNPLIPLAGVAAAAVFAVLAIRADRARGVAEETSKRLTAQLQALKDARPVENPEQERSVIAAMVDAQLDTMVDEVVVWAELDPDSSEVVRRTLLAGGRATRETVHGASRGEISFEQLRTIDTLAGLDDELMKSLSDKDYEAVKARLERGSRQAAERSARGLVTDLRAVVALSDAQAASVEKFLVEGTAWRRDLQLFPEPMARALAAHLIGSGGTLRKEARAMFTDEQAARVGAFLAKEDEARRKRWDELKGSH